MSTAMQRVIDWLDAHHIAVPRPPEIPDLRGAEARIGERLPPQLHALYHRVAPGQVHLFSPVSHQAGLQAWPMWSLDESVQRLEAHDEALWQLTPALDVWLDTNETTILRTDDHDDAFPDVDAYWADRLAELERSAWDPMMRLWLPPELQSRRVEPPEGFVEFVLREIWRGDDVVVPGIGRFSPDSGPPPRSHFDFTPARAGPSLFPEGLDRLEPVQAYGYDELAERWGRELAWVEDAVHALHDAVDEALQVGPVRIGDFVRLQCNHNPARMLPTPDEPVELPASRTVTSRTALHIIEAFAAHGIR